MKTYIVIVNWNGWKDTIECLESVFHNEYKDFCVILCDNGSNDDSIFYIEKWFQCELCAYPESRYFYEKIKSKIRSPLSYKIIDSNTICDSSDDNSYNCVIIKSKNNLGFACANNLAIDYIRNIGDYNYIWFLNNDTFIDSNALSKMLDKMESNPSAGFCGSTLVEYFNVNKIQAYGGGWYCKYIALPWHLGRLNSVNHRIDPDKIEKYISYIIGASFMVSRNVIERVGCFSSEFFLYYEELDLVYRSNKNFMTVYQHESYVYHKLGKSIGTKTSIFNKSLTCEFYSIRNRLYFTKKYHFICLPTVYATIILGLLVRILFLNFNSAKIIVYLMFNFHKDIVELNLYFNNNFRN